MIKTVINVEAPRTQVFSVLTDYLHYKDWLPGCERSDVVASSENTADTEIVVQSMKKMTLGLRFDAQPTQALNFRMVNGKDIKAYAGCYRLMDSVDGKGTVIVAELEIDAGPMAPRFLVDRMAKKAVEDTGAALKKYVRTLPALAPAAPAKVAAKGRPLRSRRILSVFKTPAGDAVWYMGRSFTPNS